MNVRSCSGILAKGMETTTKGLTGHLADRKVWRPGLLDPSRLRFLVEGFSATGDCVGRCSLQWQLFGDGQGTCARHTAESVQRLLGGTPINLAGSNLEYSYDPASVFGSKRFFAKVRRFLWRLL